MQTGQEPFVQPTGATGGGPHSSWWLGFEGEFFRMLHACFFLCTNTKRAVNDTLHTTPDTELGSHALGSFCSELAFCIASPLERSSQVHKRPRRPSPASSHRESVHDCSLAGIAKWHF